jgi:hypothetical protein
MGKLKPFYNTSLLSTTILDESPVVPFVAVIAPEELLIAYDWDKETHLILIPEKDGWKIKKSGPAEIIENELTYELDAEI